MCIRDRGDVDAVEFDIDQLAAGADSLQLQIAVLADQVLQVTPERALPIDGAHRHRRIANHHRRAFLGVDELRPRRCGDPPVAGDHIAVAVAVDRHSLAADSGAVATGDGAAVGELHAKRCCNGVESGLVDQPCLERTPQPVDPHLILFAHRSATPGLTPFALSLIHI